MKSVYSTASLSRSPTRQRGAVTLLVAVLALVLITIMTVYTASVGVMDQRMAGNEFRYREAAAAAEGGLNQAVAYFKARPTLLPSSSALGDAAWTSAGNYTDMIAGPITLSNGAQISWARAIHCTQAQVTTVCPQPKDAGGNPVTPYNYNVFRAQGVVTDAAGTTEATAVVEQKIAFAATTGSSAPNAPVIAAGNVALGGNFNIVANPNGGSKAGCTESDCTAQGVALSVWTSSTVTAAGSSATCNQSGFDAQQNKCGSDLISSGGNGTDVVANDPTVSNGGNFPDDVFEYLFGVKTANYTTIRDRAIQITDCGSVNLNASSVGLYWYTGAECDVAGPVAGAAADDAGTTSVVEGPVILVVQDADFKMNANTTFNGIIFIFSTNGAAHNVKSNGGALLNGVLMTNGALNDQLTGTFTAKYDADILEQLAPSDNNMNNGPANGTPSDVPGSWHDF